MIVVDIVTVAAWVQNIKMQRFAIEIETDHNRNRLLNRCGNDFRQNVPNKRVLLAKI